MEKQPLMENENEGTSRRDFLKFCSMVAAAIGMGPAAGKEVMAALTSPTRPIVLWLHFAECTACTESLLRTANPYIDDLLLDTLSVDYHETLMAGAGSTVHDILIETANKNSGKFICVVEGSIPTKDNGVYGTINGKTMLSIAEEVCPKAKCIISIGTCASFGGIAAAAPNPTGAKNVIAALKHLNLPQVINVPGCPPNPVSFVGVIANYLLKGQLPPTDTYLRPLFAYGEYVHDLCPFNGESAEQMARCLQEKGCKGPATYNNCPKIKFNNAANFPMNAGHVCIGCSEPKFWDINPPFWGKLADDIGTPPTPLEVFEKEVTPIPAVSVLPRHIDDGRLMQTNNQPQMFDLTGRKMSMKAPRGAMQRKQNANKMLIDKTGNLIKKHLDIK